LKDLKFEKPQSSIQEVLENGNKCKIIISPLERGWGLTLGNSLRRILLSSLPGCAIVKIKLEGAHHEFSALEGVVEDLMTIILNLKKIVLQTDSLDPNFETEMEIDAKEGIVTAADIIHSNNVEVINLDQHIATVAAKGRFRMTLTARRGVGYIGSVKNKKFATQLGEIAIDSIFTPILNVNFAVEKVMVDDNADLDKLILNVETNGSIQAKDAVAIASKMLTEHLDIFVELSDEVEEEYMKPQREDNATKKLEMIIEELDLTVRSYNCLKRAGINTVAELAAKSEEDMNKVRNLGRKSLKEIKEKLASLGLSFNKD